MHVVIIGNGVSGISSARWIRKLSDHKITVISSESKYFFSRTALMYVYMGHMQMSDIEVYEPEFWYKNRIELIQDRVESINYEGKELILKSSSPVHYDQLILALGSSPNKFGWPGQDLDGVSGLYSLQDLNYVEEYSADLERAVVVGGGLIGIELAEMFNSRKIPTTMLVRENAYWDNVLPKEEAEIISRHIRHHGIDLRLSVNLEEIIGDDNGRAKAVRIKETGETIDCGFIGLTAGVHPNVKFLRDTELEIDRGILVDSHLRTNLDGVYAVGDCVQLKQPTEGRRAIEAVWYTGKKMGKVAAMNICGQATPYDPGVWYNSAKFMDIEYQVYGTVLPNPPADHHSFYWEDSANERSIRIVFDASTKAVIGFNVLGVRFRHEVCEKWILDRTPVDSVMKDLELVNFDPEFYKSWGPSVIKKYNKDFDKNINLNAKGSLNKVLKFLKL